MMPWLAAGALALAGLWGCKGGETPKSDPPDKAPPKASAPAKTDKAGKKGPVIACDKPLHEYGKVVQGDEMKHVFTIRNVGDDVLNILSARGG